MKKKKFSLMLAALIGVAALGAGCAEKEPGNTDDGAFLPRLDTSAGKEIELASFFGNFEALDKVINDFNEFYPGVKITYAQYKDTKDNFLQENPSIDIMMTSGERGYDETACVNLAEEGIDGSTLQENIRAASVKDGKMFSLPMGLKLDGMVVNKTLLANEGLAVPGTWQEFLDVLSALKQKGYTPIQGPDNYMNALTYGMNMCLLSKDSALLDAVKTNDEAGASKLTEVYEKLATLGENGYFTQEVNATYPDNNYDGAIMNFFKGDVPFWLCDTEKVSGMKKRETRSEEFKANPFEYEFMLAPMGENGAYAWVEPWYGFAVNKNSDVCDYATEFLRFMSRTEELNAMASIKGIPSAAAVSSDERYAGLANAKMQVAAVCDYSIPSYFGSNQSVAAYDLLHGTYSTPAEALRGYLAACYEREQTK